MALMMEKRFMVNCHASLDSTCKSRISKLSHVWGAFHNFWSLTEKWKIYIDIFYAVSCNIKFQICIFNRKNGKLTFSNGPQLMEKSLWQIGMHQWTVHVKVEFQNFVMLGHRGSIPQLLILNWEMKDLHWYLSMCFLLY